MSQFGEQESVAQGRGERGWWCRSAQGWCQLGVESVREGWTSDKGLGR